MSNKQMESLRPMPEQLAYANLLSFGAWLGIAVMVVTYLLYVLGIFEPHVNTQLIIQHWGGGVQEYLKITDSPHGWGWVKLLNKGDFINFIGLAFLALLTVICYLFLIFGYFRRKDWPYLVIAVLEVLVLTAAASGIFGSGGH